MLKPQPLPALGRLMRRASADRDGTALVEFAFIAPLLILLFFALAQLSQAIVANRHTSHAASAVGDLVAQCANASDSDLVNIFAAGSDMLAPLPATAGVLSQTVTSVEAVDSKGTTQAQWSEAADFSNPNSPKTKPGPYTVNQAVTLPPNISSTMNQNDSVILEQTTYNYNFPVSTGGLIPIGGANVSLSFGNAITFNVVTYFKPRRSALVTYTGSGPGGSGKATSCYSS